MLVFSKFNAVLSLSFTKNDKPKTGKPKLEIGNFSPASGNSQPETDNPKPETILEINIHRPDRIIFEGKEIEVTSKEFSLIHLLAQHHNQVMSYDEILDEL